MAKNRELWKNANFYPELRDKLAKDIISAGDVSTAIDYANKYSKYTDDAFTLLKESGKSSDVIKWINTIGFNYYSTELVGVFMSKIKGNNNKKNNLRVFNSFVEVIYRCIRDEKTASSDIIIADALLLSLMGEVINSNNSVLLINWLRVLGDTKYVNNKKFIIYFLNFYSTKVNNLGSNFSFEMIRIMINNNNCEYTKEFKILCINNANINSFIEIARIIPPYSYSIKEFYEGLPKEYELGVVL